MNQQEVVDQIRGMGGIDVFEADGDYYFFYDPEDGTPVDRRHPFATLVTADRHDPASNLTGMGSFV